MKVKVWDKHFAEEKIKNERGAKSETGRVGKKRKMKQKPEPYQTQKITKYFKGDQFAS